MPTNVRSEDMWRYISGAHSFYNETVTDFGCGYGDMCLSLLENGAQYVAAIDADMKMLIETRDRTTAFDNIHFFNVNIDDIASGKFLINPTDVAFCFSVIPYLRDPMSLLAYLSKNFRKVFLEVQYYGDGPGPPWWTNDCDFKDTLVKVNFWNVTKIGSTTVEGRNTERTIWMCDGRRDERTGEKLNP